MVETKEKSEKQIYPILGKVSVAKREKKVVQTMGGREKRVVQVVQTTEGAEK